MTPTQRALLVASIQEGIMNPAKDMPDPEELFAKILREEINLELWGNKEGVPPGFEHMVQNNGQLHKETGTVEENSSYS